MIPREAGLVEPLPETSTLRVYSATAPSAPSPSGVGAQCTLRAATRRPSTAITSSNDVVFVRDVAHDLLHEISWPTSASSQANTPPGTDDAWVRSPRPATHVSATYALQHVDRTLSHADYGPERCVGSHFEGSLGGHVPAATLTMYHVWDAAGNFYINDKPITLGRGRNHTVDIIHDIIYDSIVYSILSLMRGRCHASRIDLRGNGSSQGRCGCASPREKHPNRPEASTLAPSGHGQASRHHHHNPT